MARAKARQRKPRPGKKATRPRRRTSQATWLRRWLWRLGVSVLLLGGSALAWMSLLSHSPADWPRATRPPGHAMANMAGVAGACTSYGLLGALGGGAYLAVLFVTAAGLLVLLTGRIKALIRRLVGASLLIAVTSSALYLADPRPTVEAGTWPAGQLGQALGGFLLSRFAVAGGWVIVVAAGLLAVLLSAGGLLLALGQRLAEVRARRRAQAPPAPAPPPEGAAQPTQAEPAPPREPPSTPPPSRAPGAAAPEPTRPCRLPSPELLAEPGDDRVEAREARALERREQLRQVLSDFDLAAEIVAHDTGPAVTLFELSLPPGAKTSQLSSLETDIARMLAVPAARVVPSLPGRTTVGVEVPNDERETVRLRELLAVAAGQDPPPALPLFLGKEAGGRPLVADLTEMPHLLIAGTTGSGKSVCLNSIIMSVLMTRLPTEARLILIDPKAVEMGPFDGVPHLLCPIVTDVGPAERVLEWAAAVMDERYDLLRQAGARDLAGYNRLREARRGASTPAGPGPPAEALPPRLPYCVLVVDEMADLILTAGKEVRRHIVRIAQKARAVGIHLVLATQRPTVNVVTGLIKANMPSRISFRVASRQESRIVLDRGGAETLLGQGDLLLLRPQDGALVRAQGTFVSEAEVRGVVADLRRAGPPSYDPHLMGLAAP